MFVDFLQAACKFRQLDEDLQHLVVSLSGLLLVNVAEGEPYGGSPHGLEERVPGEGEEDGPADGIALGPAVDVMLQDGGRGVDGGAVDERTFHIVLHLDDHPAPVLQAAVDVEAGITHLAHGNGDVAGEKFQALDVVVREEPVQQFEEDVLVLLASQKILEAPVGGRVDETLVLVVDEFAVLACVPIFRPRDLAKRSVGSAMASSLLKHSANLGSPTAGYE